MTSRWAAVCVSMPFAADQGEHFLTGDTGARVWVRACVNRQARALGDEDRVLDAQLWLLARKMRSAAERVFLATVEGLRG